MVYERVPVWLREEKEPPRAYAAFCIYRDMGKERSFRKTVIALGRVEGYIRSIEKWSSRYAWVERVHEYDAYLNDQKSIALEKVTIDNAEVWARRQTETREIAYSLSNALFDKARQMLNFPITKVTKREEEDGKIIYTTIEPARWSLRDIARFVDVANKVSRLAVELPTEVIEVMPDLIALASDRNINLGMVLKELLLQMKEA